MVPGRSRCSSHPAQRQDLELYEIQAGEGPCLDAFSQGAAIHVVGAEQMLLRWPLFGRQLVDSGLQSVCASPLRWRGTTIGAFNAFLTDPEGLTSEFRTVLQAFADIATVAVVQLAMPELPDLRALTHAALECRTIVEQAKGVLAYQHGVSVDEGYDILLERVRRSGALLEDEARAVVEGAIRRSAQA